MEHLVTRSPTLIGGPADAGLDGAGAELRPLNVLVLEDSFADFDAIRRALSRIESANVTVKRAKTLEEARLARSHDHFDVAFIDYNLGTESGARFLEEIGGRGSSTVPILVTGLVDRCVQAIALQAGAIAVINKADITPSLLETTIRTVFYTRDVEAKLHEMIARISMRSEPAT